MLWAEIMFTFIAVWRDIVKLASRRSDCLVLTVHSHAAVTPTDKSDLSDELLRNEQWHLGQGGHVVKNTVTGSHLLSTKGWVFVRQKLASYINMTIFQYRENMLPNLALFMNNIIEIHLISLTYFKTFVYGFAAYFTSAVCVHVCVSALVSWESSWAAQWEGLQGCRQPSHSNCWASGVHTGTGSHLLSLLLHHQLLIKQRWPPQPSLWKAD